MALRGLRAHQVRGALTALGIIIGVAAVILLAALGDGMRAGFLAAFGPMASQITLTATPGSVPGGGLARDLKESDVAALRDIQRAPDVASATPVVTGSAVLRTGERQYRANIIGSTPEYLDVTARTLLAGAFLPADDPRSTARIVVLGPGPAQTLFDGDGDGDGDGDAGAAIGRSVRIDRADYTVIGVLRSDGKSDNAVIMPLNTARANLVGSGESLSQIIVKAAGPATVPQALDQVTRIMDARHFVRDPAKRDFEARTMGTLIEQSTRFLGYLTVFTAAVAAISLLVGAVGVANIMLVAVTERTREIGIRKALGATRRVVMSQFLIETIVLTGLGGLLGVIIGVGMSLVAAAVLPLANPSFPAPEVTVGPVLVAFGVSLLIGVAAGCYPAARAATMRPIEALRYE